MVSARAWSIWSGLLAFAGAWAVFGVLATSPALAAHMASGESKSPMYTRSASSEQQLARESTPREAVTDSVSDAPDPGDTDSAPQPAESPTINARVPGVSDATLARFKKRMYRQDI